MCVCTGVYVCAHSREREREKEKEKIVREREGKRGSLVGSNDYASKFHFIPESP
jgi:hypothetical protein